MPPAQSTATTTGKRPRNRRALILAAAADLFARLGYDQTGMSEIATAVSIGPSALYRHFPGKQQLLAEVVTAGLRPVDQLIDELDLTDRSGALRRLAALALDQRHIGLLWQREARHLAPDARTRTRDQLRHIGSRLAEQVGAARPSLGSAAADFVAWSLIATFISPSFHHTDLPRPEHEELLADLLATVLDTELPAGYTAAPPPPGNTPNLNPASRREALLIHATCLFATYGYTEVGIEDIGSSVGITGPSVYNHYPSKQDMLTTAFQRGAAALFMDLAAACRATTDPAQALVTLIRSYIGFSGDHHHLIGLLITETDHLPPEERQRAHLAQRDYLNEWVHLLQSVHPHVDRTSARIRVHAAIDVVNNVARTAHLRRNPDTPAALTTLCTRLLGIHDEARPGG